MKLLFCGIASDDSRFNSILEYTNSAPFAEQKLERLMLSGLAQLCVKPNVEILSIFPVPRFPIYPKCIVHNAEDVLEGMKAHYIGFINLPILKQLTSAISFFLTVLDWIKKNKKEEKVVFLYGTNPLYICILVILRLFSDIKLVSYVSEIDSFRLLNNSSFLKRIKNRLFVLASTIVSDSLDAYIYISKYMQEQINKHKRPYLVIEGMVNFIEKEISVPKKKHILYAGSLDKRYGIANLIDAFEYLNLPEYNLIIYGSGDYMDELQRRSEKNSRIEYRGVVNNETILQAEYEAELLVNPRPSSEKFTRYSFPSKTFEYMLSKTPCLITRLPGIPDEYFKFCYTFDEESPENMAETIKEVLTSPAQERETLAKNAFEFVIKKKNNRIQMERIWHFLMKEVVNK